MKNRILVLGLLLSTSWVTSVNANLIINGGFENPTTGNRLGGGSDWDYYAAASVPGWEGDNIELWTGRQPTAIEGQRYAELNAHGNNSGAWSIFQTFDTIANQTYDFSFIYSARRGNTEISDEAFNVSVDNLNFNLSNHVAGSWLTSSNRFIADSTSTTLRFTSITPYSGTYGNFLDKIEVTAVVPEPSILALFSLGLAGLGFARRRNS